MPNHSLRVDYALEEPMRFFLTLSGVTELAVHMIQSHFILPTHSILLYLPKLTKLTITSDLPDINYLGELCSTIYAPVCKTFSLHLVIGYEDAHQPWVMAAVSNCENRMPAVETFDLVVRRRHVYQKTLINNILQQFPRLGSFQIDGIDFEYVQRNMFFFKFPPLRKIRLSNVKNVEQTFFFDLVEHSRGVLSDLESVVFDRCERVEVDEIQELVSKDRIILMD